MFWITDLSIKDPFFILPIIMGVTMFIQQQLNPTPPDPMHARVMKLLPIIFTFFFLWFPAGLVLYWVVNNCLSIAQQWYITRKIERQTAAATCSFDVRSEEHPSELPSLMRISYAVFCLKKKTEAHTTNQQTYILTPNT